MANVHGLFAGWLNTFHPRRVGAARAFLSNLSLPRKVALIPLLTLLLMGLTIVVAEHMAEHNTSALRAIDRDVFEPLNRAQTLKDRITLLHTRLFALLSIGSNQSDPRAQQRSAEELAVQLDAERARFGGFLAATTEMMPEAVTVLNAKFDAYIARAHETVDFAAYDGSYGALLAGVTDEHFAKLRAGLDDVVQALATRRSVLAAQAVSSSLDAQHLLLGLGIGTTMLALLGSVMVGRSIARPVVGLTKVMNRLAAGNTDVAVPGTEQSDEVGAMARAVEIFRANAVARRQGEAELRRINLLFDAALNSMLQGMIVWGPDHRTQLVNRRWTEICGMPPGTLRPGMTVRDIIESLVHYGLHPEADPDQIITMIEAILMERRSTRGEIAMRPGLLVRIASEPMADGGTVVTFEDVTEMRRNEDQIAFMAHHDALTGLANRLQLEERLAAAVGRAGADEYFALLCLDLDRFKEVNDSLGHSAGDEVLRIVAGRLRNTVRSCDTVARLGGDEFAVLMSCEDACPDAAAVLAQRLIDAIGSTYRVQDCDLTIGTSIGIALLEVGVAGTELLQRADVALYRAKEARGTFAFFEPGMYAQLHAIRGLESDLRLALQRGEFEVYYQPIYNLSEDRITGFEALLRWNSPTRGRVSPGEFIPLAERSGLIVPIGAWVLRTACTAARAWPDHVRVAVNLSPVQFKYAGLLRSVGAILEETGLPGRRLELEITESALLEGTDNVVTVLHGLHELGIRISMDDFGTGYSSLCQLHRFPFDKIKIDRSFVSDLDVGPVIASGAVHKTPTSAQNAALIVRAIASLGENLGIATTAEGVETAEQLERIRDEGCTEVQGFFISPPRPESEIAAILQRMEAGLTVASTCHADHLSYSEPRVVLVP
jgi:diguanylate cyclase (GGDEF)-like protein